MPTQDEYVAAIRASLVAWSTEMSAWDSETGKVIEDAREKNREKLDARANGVVPAAEDPWNRLAAETLLISKRLRAIGSALAPIGPCSVTPRHQLSATPSAESHRREVKAAAMRTRRDESCAAGWEATHPVHRGSSALRWGRGNAATRTRSRVHMTHIDCGVGQWLHLAAIVDYHDQQAAGTRACLAWRSGGQRLSGECMTERRAEGTVGQLQARTEDLLEMGPGSSDTLSTEWEKVGLERARQG